MLHRSCSLWVRLALVESLVVALGLGVLLFLGFELDAETLTAAAGFARF